MNSERLDFEQLSMHFGTFARKMDPRISENGPQNHPKVHLGPCHTQARGQRNLETQKGPPSRCFWVISCTTWIHFPFWRRGSDRVAAARLFQGSKPSKIVPPKIHFQEVQTLKNRSQKVHFTSPQTLPITLYASKGCMPSEDLYALKGLVCPQGTGMPSRDLYALKGLACPCGHTSPLMAYKSFEGLLEGIQIL